MTVLNKTEIARQIAAAEGLTGNELETRVKTLEVMSEKALNEKLSSTLNGQASKPSDIESDGWDFVGVNVNSNPRSTETQSVPALAPLSHQEAKDYAIQSLNDDVKKGFDLLKSVDNGKIGQLYDKWKEKQSSFLSLPSTMRALYLQEKSNNLLELSNQNQLTKKQYYEALKGTLLEIYPGVESMSELEKSVLEQKINTLSPAKLKRWQDNVLRLPQEGSKGFDDAVKNFDAMFEMETTDEESKIVQNGDGQTILNEKIRTLKPSYELKSGTGDELMKFEQTFKLERGVEFNKDNISAFNAGSALYQLTESKGMQLDAIKETLKSPLSLVKGNNQSAVPPEVAERSNQQLEVALYQSLRTLYGDDDTAINKGLQDLSGFEGLVFENGKLKNKVTPKAGSPFGSDVSVPYAQAAENVIKSLENNYKKLLNGKTREEYAQNYAMSYADAYGKANASKLANAYMKDQQEGVQNIRSMVEYGGGAVMVAGMFIFPPAALVGGAVSSLGGAGVELYDESTKQHSDSARIEELKKEMLTNGLLMGVGMGAGKIGQAVNKGAQAMNVPKLAAYAADMGTDAAISLVGDLALTGQINLEGEGFSQAMSLIIGHKNKVSSYAKKGVNFAGTKMKGAFSNSSQTAFKSKMTKIVDSAGKPIFSDFELKQMAKAYSPENLEKIPSIYEKITEHNDPELFKSVISNPALIKSQNLGLVEDILNIKVQEFEPNARKRFLCEITESNIEYFETITDAIKRRGNEVMFSSDINYNIGFMNKESLPYLKKALNEKAPNCDYLYNISDIPSFCQKGYKAYRTDKLPQDVKDFLVMHSVNINNEIFYAIENCPKGSKLFDELTSMARSNDLNYKIDDIVNQELVNETLKIVPGKKIRKKLETYFDSGNKLYSPVEMHGDFVEINKISDPVLKNSALKELDKFLDNYQNNTVSKYDITDKITDICELDAVLSGKSSANGTVEGYLRHLNEKNPVKAQEMFKLLEDSAPEQKSKYQKLKDRIFGNVVRLQISKTELRDLKLDKEIAPLKEWIAKGGDPKIAAKMYETKYLYRLSPAAREIAAKIDKDFGIKVFMSDTDNPESLQMVYNEMLAWKKAGKQDAKFPKVLDFTRIDSTYFNRVAAYQSGTVSKIGFKSSSKKYISYALRHEMMHENDLYRSEYGTYDGIDSEYIINNKKYYDEIKKGLEANKVSAGHTNYAYTNRKEFLAVASEGDYSVYSDEFKDVLVKLGMPKWVLKMENKRTIDSKTQVYSHKDYSHKYTALQNAKISSSARNMYTEAVNSMPQVQKDYSGIFTSVKDAKFMSRVKDMDKVFEKHYRRLESFDKQIKKAQESLNLTPEQIAEGKKPRTQEQVNTEIERLQKLKGEALKDLQKIRDDIQDTIGARIVMDDCSDEATDRIVYDLINAIDKGEIEVLSLENYCGDGLRPYFSSKQIKKIRQHCRAQGYEPVITSVVNKKPGSNMDYDKMFNPKNALKPSGYTTAQLNVKHKNGAISELQVRGKVINELAESEHIIYDLKEGKDLIGGNPQKQELLGDLPKIIENIYKEKDNPLQNTLSQYLTECYTYARKTELGESVPKPVLPPVLDKQLDIDNIIRIHSELGKIK